MELLDKINKLSLQAQTTPLCTTCDTGLLFEVLNEVKEILEAKPSETLKHFNHFEKWYRKICYRVVTSFELDYDLETIKQYILKAQEQEKVLKVILKKQVDINEIKIMISNLKHCDDIERCKRYNASRKVGYKLKQEEFNSIKEMLKNV